MKTRYSSLVTVKKSDMQKSERALQSANADLRSASTALDLSYESLNDIPLPNSGNMSAMLASRSLLESQRGLIYHNKEWIEFAKKQVLLAKEKLKVDMIEYEKFNYLNVQEIEKILKEREIQEVKDLDEVALMTYMKKRK
jgi:flagellar biosynthesis chaperone FliJ